MTLTAPRLERVEDQVLTRKYRRLAKRHVRSFGEPRPGLDRKAADLKGPHPEYSDASVRQAPHALPAGAPVVRMAIQEDQDTRESRVVVL